MDYNKTINLPKTDFPMRAGLPKREPEMLKRWEDMDLYNELLKKNEGKPRFSLHDGPPFSNGSLHMGHALNKSLKDIIVRSYAMRGPYRLPRLCRKVYRHPDGGIQAPGRGGRLGTPLQDHEPQL